jgi:predicted metal-binding membrane protein
MSWGTTMVSRRSKGDPAAALMAIVLGLAATAWIAMIALHEQLHGNAYSQYLATLPPQLRQAVSICGALPNAEGLGFANWIAGWALMTVAMMLPPALPLLRAFRRLTTERVDASQLMAFLAVAFLGIWVAAGLALYLGGTLLSRALQLLPALAEQASLLAGIAALLAGAYQFTPLKMACLDACRSPMSVIMTRWQSAHPAQSSMKIGVVYGAICVGCCWALMLLSVVAGAMALQIMAAANVIMMLERLLPSVRPLIPIQAGLAIAVGLMLIAGTIPPAFFVR